MNILYQTQFAREKCKFCGNVAFPPEIMLITEGFQNFIQQISDAIKC